jgi:hypothetical protein
MRRKSIFLIVVSVCLVALWRGGGAGSAERSNDSGYFTPHRRVDQDSIRSHFDDQVSTSMPAVVRIVGSVFGADGPLSGAIIKRCDNGQTWSSDAAGRFMIESPAGYSSLELQFSATNYYSSIRTMRAGVDYVVGLAPLRPGRRVRLIAAQPSARAAEWVHVLVRDHLSDRSDSTATDRVVGFDFEPSDEGYEFSSPFDNIDVIVWTHSTTIAYFGGVGVPQSVDSVTELKAVLLPGASAYGKISPMPPQAISGCRVVAIPAALGRSSERSAQSIARSAGAIERTATVRSAAVGPSGEFTIAGLSSDLYRFIVADAHGEPQLPHRDVEVREGEVVGPIEFQWPVGRAVDVVVSLSGEPIWMPVWIAPAEFDATGALTNECCPAWQRAPVFDGARLRFVDVPSTRLRLFVEWPMAHDPVGFSTISPTLWQGMRTIVSGLVQLGLKETLIDEGADSASVDVSLDDGFAVYEQWRRLLLSEESGGSEIGRIRAELRRRRAKLDEIDQQFNLIREALVRVNVPTLRKLLEAVDGNDARRLTLMAIGRLPVF